MKDIDKAVKLLEKTFKDTEILSGKALANHTIDKISTGSMWMDYTLKGGFPRGRVVELYGQPSSGKSLIAYRAIAQAQKEGHLCVFIDAERTFDSKFVSKLGVDVENLIVIGESRGEIVFDMIEEICENHDPAIVVIDSIAALVPQYEDDNSMEQQTVGIHARLISKGLRKITGKVANSNTCLLLINQIREKIGVYGNPETTTGGNALSFYTSVRVEIRRGDYLTLSERGTEEELEDATAHEKKQRIGQEIKFKLAKSKISKPFQTGRFEFYYNGVVNEADELVSLLEVERIIERRGAYYYMPQISEDSFQGRQSLVNHIRDNEEYKKQAYALLTDKDNITTKKDGKKK